MTARHVWGVDVSTRRVAVVAVGVDGPAVQATAQTRLGPETADAERLHSLLTSLRDTIGDLAATCPPLAVFVEVPTGKHPKPLLVGAWGMTLACLWGTLHLRWTHPVSVFTLRVSEWKKAAVGHGNASKPQVATWAEGEGFAAQSQDHADAYGIARAGLRMVADSAIDRQAA